jgi:ABC-type antimicrobial peptide transport system permease subunit
MMQDRESFSAASVDFINSIVQTNPYVVGRLDSERLSRLEGSLVNVVIHADGTGNGDALIRDLLALRRQGKIPPFAAVTTEGEEKQKLGSDMFIYLALENIKVFLTGGVLVALAGLIAIALVNFIERKRTFALVRLRGASPRQMIRIMLADLVAPLAMGACIGIPVGLVTGYGLTNAIFALPRAASILRILPVHLTLRWFVGVMIGGLLLFFFISALLLSAWIFRKTAREAVLE